MPSLTNDAYAECVRCERIVPTDTLRFCLCITCQRRENEDLGDYLDSQYPDWGGSGR